LLFQKAFIRIAKCLPIIDTSDGYFAAIMFVDNIFVKNYFALILVSTLNRLDLPPQGKSAL
jgi:hypothetical protein